MSLERIADMTSRKKALNTLQESTQCRMSWQALADY
jgi:hypothetical protein